VEDFRKGVSVAEDEGLEPSQLALYGLASRCITTLPTFQLSGELKLILPQKRIQKVSRETARPIPQALVPPHRFFLLLEQPILNSLTPHQPATANLYTTQVSTVDLIIKQVPLDARKRNYFFNRINQLVIQIFR
jgi:hypothetical protein